MRLFIHATNISQGGGRSLLVDLLNALARESDIVLQLDSRMRVPEKIMLSQTVRMVKPTIANRLFAEWWLANNVKKGDTVFCFGSLPPLMKLKGRVVVFVQNRYLIEKHSLGGFSIKTTLRIKLERLWLWFGSSKVAEYIVQTPTMKSILKRSGYSKGQPIHIRPFIAEYRSYERSYLVKTQDVLTRYDFIYVASGEPHKNHRRLIEAWCLLACQNLYPTLCLTIDKNSSAQLCRWINEKKDSHRLKIKNYGTLSYDQTLKLYAQAGAMIYPSRLESFGLPLIEASQAGLPILASELDYVRDIIDPVETFDPYSPLSIARAVKRYLGVKEADLELTDASSFLKFLMNDLMAKTNKP